MINLTIKAAKRYRIEWAELTERPGDYWKIDIEIIDRKPILFLVHEYTLFTLIRRKAQFRTLDGVGQEIQSCCPWYRYVGRPSLGKNGNRRLSGSINEMKHTAKGHDAFDNLDRLETAINKGLYSYLAVCKYDYGVPLKAVESYRAGEMPWLDT